MKKTFVLLAIAVLMVMPMKAQQCEVKFDLNYDTTDQVESISVQQGCALPLDKKPMPQREGYRFGGWYTSKEGKAQDEWLFGKMVGMMGAFMAQANDSIVPGGHFLTLCDYFGGHLGDKVKEKSANKQYIKPKSAKISTNFNTCK